MARPPATDQPGDIEVTGSPIKVVCVWDCRRPSLLARLRRECGSAWVWLIWCAWGIGAVSLAMIIAAVVFKNLGWME